MQQTLLLSAILLFAMTRVLAGEIRVAVASNFTGPAREIARRFETKSADRVILIFGSTGRHYAQIRHGAPFDLFFAADSERPRRLEQQGLALPGSRFTYALGRLVLWSPRAGLVDARGEVLAQGDFHFLALANPRFAPYGKAAEQVLRRRGLWEGLQGRLVRGENIGQTFHFVTSGNAELGFVAYSQIHTPDGTIGGSWWKVPQSLYDPIEQQAVLLKEGEAPRAFLDYAGSDEARAIIRGFGYATP